MTKILAVLEQRDGALRKVSHEVVTGARRLADALGGTVEAVVCGAAPVQGADQMGKFGADTVVTLTTPAFARYAPEGCAQAIAERAKAGGYAAVVFAASATGKDLAPRVAAKLGVGLAADLTDVGAEGGGGAAPSSLRGRSTPARRCSRSRSPPSRRSCRCGRTSSPPWSGPRRARRRRWR